MEEHVYSRFENFKFYAVFPQNELVFARAGQATRGVTHGMTPATEEEAKRQDRDGRATMEKAGKSRRPPWPQVAPASPAPESGPAFAPPRQALGANVAA